MTALSVRDIKKSYGMTEALKGLSFEVESGETFGLIGPDGAGKTTLFRILATLLTPDGGSAFVEGIDVVTGYRAIRQRVGYMPGRFSLYPDLTVEENISFFAAVFGSTLRANYGLIHEIYRSLEPFKNRRAGKLSGGMKQKLALCCALIHKPSVLLLDEPTTGVDPVSRQEFRQMLRRLRDGGITILVSTPYMDEATHCDRIALMNDGAFLTIDTPTGLIEKFAEPLYAASSARMSDLLRDLRRQPEVKSCYAFGQVHHVALTPDADLPSLETRLRNVRHTDLELRRTTPTVEDCFIALNRSRTGQY
jgi:ABC-type multidrug transport system ATPase subunit